MAATWKIGPASAGYDDASCKTLAQLGITDLRIKFANHADDVATWTCDGAGLGSAPHFGHGEEIAIWRKNGNLPAGRVFSGVVTSLPRYGNGTGQRHQFEARGGWYWLTKGFYTQGYAVSDGTTSGTCSKTRVVIGYGENGSVTPTAQIDGIVDQCAARTGRIARTASGDIAVSSVKVPGDEEVDLTWADAVNRILRWFPDTAVWFDHTQFPARCRMARRGALSIRNWGVSDGVEVEATPRYDLQVPGVRIDYEITTAVETEGAENEGKRYRNVVTRTAGNPSAIGAAHFTVELDGGTETRLKQKILAENLPGPLPTSGTPGSAWQAFFGKYIPELQGKALDSFACDSPWFPRTGTGVTLPRVLLRGQVQPWFPRTRNAEEKTLVFTASYRDADRVVKDKKFSVTLTLTNAATGTYAATAHAASADVPNGLAAEIWAAAGVLHWEGRFVRIGTDPMDTAGPGEVLALGGVLPGTERISGFVQAQEFDVGAGKTTVAFGPPEHLGVQDLVQLAQANRKRRTVKSQGTKASADEDADADDGATLGGPGANTHEGETCGRVAFQRFSALASGHPSAVVDGTLPAFTVADADGNSAMLGSFGFEASCLRLEGAGENGSIDISVIPTDGVGKPTARFQSGDDYVEIDGAAGTIKLVKNGVHNVTIPGGVASENLVVVTGVSISQDSDKTVHLTPATATLVIQNGLITEVSGGAAQNGNA